MKLVAAIRASALTFLGVGTVLRITNRTSLMALGGSDVMKVSLAPAEETNVQGGEGNHSQAERLLDNEEGNKTVSPVPTAGRWKCCVKPEGMEAEKKHPTYVWEMPKPASLSEHNSAARFLFEHDEVGGCCNYNRTHVLDLRSLQSNFTRQILEGPDYIILHVGVWWGTTAIGYVIDDVGHKWSIRGTPHETEWKIDNTTDTDEKPDVSFAALMKKAILMIMKLKKPHTKIVWRTEGD
ncbi:expressed unknown protein [Seminavis robusta]|uniref:Uncharacterized protein n=1 Tax=Seminavis robusta TaxID=568900 RepID=A0A9N8ER01_9STRA|nr:expressed unknown protein [Seminavis robusta]|eukprot:Sro1427_g271760.1 n/a (238) ;mRNA; r:433-1326